MSILAKQNIYGNALVRQTYEIKRPGGGALDEGFGRGDVVTAQEKAAIEVGLKSEIIRYSDDVEEKTVSYFEEKS